MQRTVSCSENYTQPTDAVTKSVDDAADEPIGDPIIDEPTDEKVTEQVDEQDDDAKLARILTEAPIDTDIKAPPAADDLPTAGPTQAEDSTTPMAVEETAQMAVEDSGAQVAASGLPLDVLEKLNLLIKKEKLDITPDAYANDFSKYTLPVAPLVLDLHDPSFLEKLREEVRIQYDPTDFSLQTIQVYIKNAIPAVDAAQDTIRRNTSLVLAYIRSCMPKLVDARIIASLVDPKKTVPYPHPAFMHKTLKRDILPNKEPCLLPPGFPMPVIAVMVSHRYTEGELREDSTKIEEMLQLVTSGHAAVAPSASDLAPRMPLSTPCRYPGYLLFMGTSPFRNMMRHGMIDGKPITLRGIGCTSPNIPPRLLDVAMVSKEQWVHAHKTYALDAFANKNPDPERLFNSLKAVDELCAKKEERIAAYPPRECAESAAAFERIKKAGLNEETMGKFEIIMKSLEDSINTNKKRKRDEQMQVPFVLSEQDNAAVWEILQQAFEGVATIYEDPADEKAMHKMYKKLGGGAPLHVHYLQLMLGNPYVDAKSFDGMGLAALISFINVVLSIATRSEVVQELAMSIEENIKPVEAAWLGADDVWGPKIIDTIWTRFGGCHQYAHKPTCLVPRTANHNHLGLSIELAMQAIKGDSDTLKFLGTKSLGALKSDNAVAYAARAVDLFFDTIAAKTAFGGDAA